MTMFKHLIAIINFWQICVFLMFICNTIPSECQTPVFYKYTLDDGLSQVSINDILEDKNGFLWLATQSGLNRFDGNIFKTFHHNPLDSNSVSGDFINCLFEDTEGNIWVGTENNGLCYYDCNQFVFRKYKTDISSYSVNQITQDANGNIWATIGGNGILKIDKKMHSIFSPDTISKPVITSVLVNNIVYCGDDQGRIYQLSGNNKNTNSVQFSEIGRVPENKRILLLKSLNDSALFIGTADNGYVVNYHKNINFRSVFNPVFQNSTIVYDIEKDSNNVYWIATGDGLYRVNIHTTSATVLNHYVNDDLNPISISNNTVYCLERTSNKMLWIGTGKNLNVLNQSPNFENINSIPGSDKLLNSNVVFSIFKEDNTFWVGTSGGGLNRFIDEEASYFKVDNSNLLSNVVFSICDDPYGNLWIGTKKGACLIPREQKLNKNLKITSFASLLVQYPKLKNIFIRKIYCDEFGNIWVCTYNNGLIKVTGNVFSGNAKLIFFVSNEQVQTEISSNRVYDIVQQNDSTYWVGTSNGLNKLCFSDKKTIIKTYIYNEKEPHSLGNSVVYCLSLDNKNRLWAGTRNGLSRYNPAEDNFQRYTKDNGLPNSIIYSIEIDEMGNLWSSTNKGLSKFNGNDESFTNFSTKDGLQSKEFNLHASFYDSIDNAMFFGGINGINIFCPEKLHHIDTIKPIIVSSMSYTKNTTTITLSEGKLISLTNRGIILNYDEFPVDFQLSTVDLRPNKNVQLVYRLFPHDIEWNDLNSNNILQILKLPYGEFKLQVQGKSRGKLWNSQPLEINIKVKPPIWLTWYAKLLYLLLFLYIVFIFYRFQLKSTLAKRETTRLIELNDLKNELYTDITHEFRTPLTVIMGIASELRSETGMKRINLIERNGNLLLNLVNQMLDLSKLDQLKLELNYIQDDVLPYFRYVFSCFSSWANEKNIKYTFYTEVDELITDFDPDQLHKIISNLLSNAIKYTPENGEVIFHFFLDQHNYCFKVSDTGIGIDKADRDLIFQRFYRSGKVKSNTGIGIGLSLTKRLTELLGGEIKLENQKKGSCFKVCLPIKNESAKIPHTNYPEFLVPKDITDQNTLEENQNKTIDDDSIKILIVEDNQDVLVYIEDCLSNKYHTLSALDGTVGINMAISEIPDLIITDLMMPGKNGFELCSAIKENIKTSHIPVVFITARATEEDKIRAYSLGADAYLVKPFNKTELVVRIEQLLANRSRILKFMGEKTEQTQNISKETAFLNLLFEEIYNELGNPNFRALDLAFKVNLSESQLYRKVKALSGRSTSLFIRYVRLKKAYELLQTNGQNVSEVCYACGFNDPAWFSRIFKEEFGISPSVLQTQ